jgi:hypothetical protein
MEAEAKAAEVKEATVKLAAVKEAEAKAAEVAARARRRVAEEATGWEAEEKVVVDSVIEATGWAEAATAAAQWMTKAPLRDTEHHSLISKTSAADHARVTGQRGVSPEVSLNATGATDLSRVRVRWGYEYSPQTSKPERTVLPSLVKMMVEPAATCTPPGPVAPLYCTLFTVSLSYPDSVLNATTDSVTCSCAATVMVQDS